MQSFKSIAQIVFLPQNYSDWIFGCLHGRTPEGSVRSSCLWLPMGVPLRATYFRLLPTESPQNCIRHAFDARRRLPTMMGSFRRGVPTYIYSRDIVPLFVGPSSTLRSLRDYYTVNSGDFYRVQDDCDWCKNMSQRVIYTVLGLFATPRVDNHWRRHVGNCVQPWTIILISTVHRWMYETYQISILELCSSGSHRG